MKNTILKTFALVLTLVVSALFGHMATAQAQDDYNSYRISGETRYETAVEIAKKGWKDGAATVVLARGDNFPDALAGAPLAKKLDAPILLSSKDALPASTKNEIKRLKAKKVILLGGFSALSDKVNKEIKSLGIQTERISGSDRYKTSIEVAKRLAPTNETAIIATGENFADALAIAPYAAEKQVPIILTKSKSLPSSSETYIKGFTNTIIVGGKAAVDIKVEEKLPSPTRISGQTRYETAAEIVRFGFDTNSHIYVSTGENFADALTGSALASKNGTAVMLVNNKEISSRTELLISEQSMSTFQVFGGKAAVSDETIKQLTSKMKQSAGTVGGATLSENVKDVSVQVGNELETAVKNGTYQDNGNIIIEVSKNSSLTKYKKGELILIPPDDENPMGLIAEVGNVSTSGDKTKIVLGQPALEDIFENLKLNIEKDLGVNDIISMDLHEGVELVTPDGTQVDSMAELKAAEPGMRLLNSALYPEGSNNPAPISLKLNVPLLEDDERDAEITLQGEYGLDASKFKAKVNKSEFWEAGLIEAFNLEFKAKQNINADLNIKWDGELPEEEEERKRIFEGVDRSQRTTLASVTFTAGAVVYGEEAMKKVPVGLTIFVVTTLDGNLSLEGNLSFVDEREFDVEAEWKKKKKDFIYVSKPVTKKSEVELSAKGELTMSQGVGLDVGLNLFSIIPAIVENDLKHQLKVEGNGKATWDLMEPSLVPELEGCILADYDVDVLSTFKSRLKANFAIWEMGFEYEKQFFKKNLYTNEIFKCVPSGKVTGTVTNAVSKEKLEKVKVTAYKDGEFYRSAQSDSNGQYELELSPGTYKLKFSKPLYLSETIEKAEVTKDGLTYNPELRLIYQDYIGDGIITGQIKNALNGSPVPGAVIEFRKGANATTGELVGKVTADASGNYKATLKAGTYTGTIKKEGFVVSTMEVLSIGSLVRSSQDGTITPILDDTETRIVLTWGDAPRDLDSHLFGKYQDLSPYHVYWNDRTAYENGNKIALLDTDDRSAYGPETITIKKQNAEIYEYMVHDYSYRGELNSTSLSSSGAKVEVYKGSYLVKTFHVPTNKTGTLWKVFKLKGNEIIPVNEMSDEYPASSDSTANFPLSIEREEKEPLKEAM
ncbi:cell wall-binding repeat-containing protein [Rossellomorea arthrocnemi]